MTSCKNFPDADSIYILESEPGSRVHKCKKNQRGAYMCEGTVEDGFWKLEPGTNGQCLWMYCKTPFKVNNGSKDYSEYSDCRITNFPYYILDEGGKCSVHNIFTGGTPEGECQTVGKNGNNKMCCTEGEICDSKDCLQYKALDKYLVSQELNYKCDGGGFCTETSPGKGDFTNPFCDYQCTSLKYPEDYTCVNGYCQQVADPDTYGTSIDCQKDEDCGKNNKCDPKTKRCSVTFYDNMFCDINCNPPTEISFNCNKQTRACETVQDKTSGQYATYSDCAQACRAGLPDITDQLKGAPQDTVSWGTLTLVLLIVLANILVIYAVVYLINRGLAKKKTEL